MKQPTTQTNNTNAPQRSPHSFPLPLPSRPIVNWHVLADQRRRFGEKAADALRNGMGSWAFVGTFIVFMVAWAIVNTIDDVAWDVYPFILLNLFLSMLAGLQGAILLIAAKRQDALSAALAQHDYETNVAAAADIEELKKANAEQSKMIRELIDLLHEEKAHRGDSTGSGWSSERPDTDGPGESTP